MEVLYHGYSTRRRAGDEKEHPCGARRWEVLRVGMDFRMRCTGCGREVMLPRKKAEKALKKIISPADQAGEDRRNPYAL